MKKRSKLLSLVMVLSKDKEKILLGMKKRGLGEGRWNGFGGKAEIGEEIEEAALREMKEEINIVPKNLQKQGIITFYEADPEPLEVHIFSCTQFEGEPEESEEMRPKWFNVSGIPYKDMWPDDKYWLPILLSGKKFRGEFWFKDQDNTDKITKYELKQVKVL